MPHDPIDRLDLEIGFQTLTSATRGLSSLLGDIRAPQVAGHHLAALLDLVTEKADAVARMAGFAPLE
jgi:hypothetical protein